MPERRVADFLAGGDLGKVPEDEELDVRQPCREDVEVAELVGHFRQPAPTANLHTIRLVAAFIDRRRLELH
jgi:hypothetical protein